MKTVILGTAHLSSTPGKRSPDGKFREYQYSRKLCNEIKKRLVADGVNCIIDFEADDMPGKNSSQELYTRVNTVNYICKQNGVKDCVYVSVHVNAASNGQWSSARGFSVFVSDNASENSKKLAELIHDEVSKYGIKIRYQHKGVKYHTSNFYVCRKTLCAAILSENGFQDNKEDVAWLTSEEGFETVVRYHVDAIKKYINI